MSDSHDCPVTFRIHLYTMFHKKEPLIFDYNSLISSSIFIILAPVESGMNTPQYHVIHLLNCLMTLYNCDTPRHKSRQFNFSSHAKINHIEFENKFLVKSMQM